MKVVITGGTGMVGKQLAFRLSAEGHDVTALGRKAAVAAELKEHGVYCALAHLEDAEAMSHAIAGNEVVYHCAALSTPWGDEKAFYQSNVVGTQNVIDACIEHGVKRLVYISTPSVYFNFKDRFGVKESDSLAEKPPSKYTETKLEAERRVMDAKNQGLEVIVLRPRGIFGPEDQVLLPRLLKAIRQKRLPVMGNGKNRVDLTYIDNLVDAMALCLDVEPSATGRIYNITNGEPVVLWDFIRSLVQELGIPYRPRSVPYSVMYGLAYAMELKATYLTPSAEPVLTRYTVGLLSKSQTLDIEEAKSRLGYQPKVSMHQGMLRVAEAFRKRGDDLWN